MFVGQRHSCQNHLLYTIAGVGLGGGYVFGRESCRDFLKGKVVSRVFRFPILSVFTDVEILLSIDFHNTREPVGETIDEDYDIVSQCSDFCPGAAVGGAEYSLAFVTM